MIALIKNQNQGARMFSIPIKAKVIFFSKPFNLLKGIDGLAAVVHNELHLELSNDTYFLFCNAKKNFFKVIYQEDDRPAIWSKRFRGTLNFKYDESIITLDHAQFTQFIHNIRFKRCRGFKNMP